MTNDRIRDLLAPFIPADALSETQLGQVSTYLDLLLKWNARMNLTAVRNPEEMVARHFGESFFAARALLTQQAESGRSDFADARDTAGETTNEPAARTEVADLGSGAGFPGLPLKIWSPEIALTLIEANQKKAVFLREVARTLSLRVTVLQTRFADVDDTVNIATIRAVERFEEALPSAAKLLKPGGRLALLIGANQAATATERLPGMAWSEPIAIPCSQSRILLVGTAQAAGVGLLPTC